MIARPRPAANGRVPGVPYDARVAYRPPFVDPAYVMVDAPHPATLEESDLLRQCEFTNGRVGGPGGQHRNRVETAVFVLHRPSGIEAQATERRSQVENRRNAIKRLRRRLASHVRTLVSRDVHQCSALWQRRRQGNKLTVNPDHEDYPGLLAEALDLVVARRYDVAGAAALLGITMSQLSRLVHHDKGAFAKMNAGREACGLPPLRK
jgi:hypothetical protein